MDKLTWKRTPVAPADVLTALPTLTVDSVWPMNLIPPDWIPSETFYEWAVFAYNLKNEFGWNAAVTYANRAVCRRIDGILLNNHLGEFCGKTNPEKIEILQEIDVPIPSLIHRALISSRNDMEHNFGHATGEQSRDLVELAQLTLSATALDAIRPAVVVIGGRVRQSFMAKAGLDGFKSFCFSAFENDPVLFVDNVDSPTLVKIIDPRDEEIRFAPLKDFKRPEAVALAKYLRQYRQDTLRPGSAFFRGPKELEPDFNVFRQFKEQANL